MRMAAAFLLLAWTPSVCAAPLLSGFATDLPGSEADDAFEIWNPDAQPLDLTQVHVTDGEGVLTFPDGSSLAAGQQVRVALRYDAYVEAAGVAPDFARDHPDPSRRVVAAASFLLAQGGDDLHLDVDGGPSDVVIWGETRFTDPGWNGEGVTASDARLRWWSRADGIDHDDATDWDRPQHARLGWREPAQPSFHVTGGATAYTAPDGSRAQVTDFIRSAQSTLRLNVYELRDPGIARDLMRQLADKPGLKLDVLLDDQPVGVDAEERLLVRRIVQELVAAGARVRYLQHDRYGYDHAKYLIADDARVLIQSENLVPTGVPLDASTGNRGWGVVIHDASLAADLAAVFDADFRLDLHGARLPEPGESTEIPLPAAYTESPHPTLGTAHAETLDVRLLVGPESNLGPHDVVLATLANATSEVLVQQLNAPPLWKDSAGREWPNQYLEAVLAAAQRGARVRVILDGHFLDGSNDNEDARQWLLDHRGDADLDVRIVGSDQGVVHNKGLVVDGRYAFVGSLNWNLHSVAQNRELLVRLDAPDLARFYAHAFDTDWTRSEGPSTPTPTLPATVICAALLGLALRRRSL